MQVRASPRTPGRVPLLPLCAAVSLFLIGGAYGWSRLPGAAFRLHCPLLALTGIPCPTCGATRALAAIATGDWQIAAGWNPLVTLTTALLLAAGTISILRHLTRRPEVQLITSAAERRLLRATALLLLAANWFYLVFSS